MRKKVAAADQHGIFQNFQVNNHDFATRERYLSMRGGESSPKRDSESLYNLSEEGSISRVPTEYVAPHLSTRYSPDRVGVQAQRVADGVYQDPITNKIYDYNDGFKTEDGRDFPGGSAALQSSMMRMANILDEKSLYKKANQIDNFLKKLSSLGNSLNSREKNNILTDAAVKLANDLDAAGLTEEADALDASIAKASSYVTPGKGGMVSLANDLDKKGLHDIADIIDSWVRAN